MPMQQIWNIVINCVANEDADNCASPIPLSITVSARFTPTVMSDWSEIGMAIFAICR